MSVRVLTNSSNSAAATSARNIRSGGVTPSTWSAPSQWLSLPDVTTGQKFAGLFAIYPDANLLALSAAGNYTVDWGDGTTTNHNSGTTAYKEYTYSSIADDGESALGYRQVIVQVYPQSGQNLTSLNLQAKHNKSGLVSNYSVPWLDVAVNGSSLTSLAIGGATVALGQLQRAMIYNHALTSGNGVSGGLFQNCAALCSVPLFNTAAFTDMTSMFNGCRALTDVPPLNTASVTSMANMFFACHDLPYVPTFNTSSVTNMSGMFQNCYSLRSVPLFNTANVTNMSSMLGSCSALTSVPQFNTSKATNTSYMFNGCSSLVSVPLLDTSSSTTMQNMFAGCYSLKTVPSLNTSKVTTMQAMFQACFAMVKIPQFSTSLVTNMSAMFNSCQSLASVPLLDTSAVTNASNMFNACPVLMTLPAINLGGVTSGNFTNTFNGCTSLSVMSATGINQTVSFASCKLSATQLNAIFTALSSTGTGKTITVTGNYGASTCDTSIATAKGWTVTT